MSQTTNAIVEAALEYAGYGWQIMPLRAKGKKPWLPEWQRRASNDEELINRWWSEKPKSNLGIQLGPRSGIIDIEGDSPESEKEILALFGDEMPVCPTFQASRGKHRLFKWSDKLPHGAVIHIGAIELRLGNDDKGAQTVFPPSVHQSGVDYVWLEGLSPSEVEPPEIPDGVAARIWNLAGEESVVGGKESRARRGLDAKEIRQGERDDTLFSMACRQAARSPNINDPQEQADLWQWIEAMNQQKCRPHLTNGEVERIHRQAIAYEQRGRAGNEHPRAFTLHGLEYIDGRWMPGDWKLTIVLGDPKQYKLYVPRWRPLTPDKTGVVVMDVETYRSHERVAAAIQAATGSIVLDDTPRVWASIWNGKLGNKEKGVKPTRGLKAILIGEADEEDPPAIDKRFIVVAEILQELLSRAKPNEGDTPDPKRPVLMTDGSIWTRWKELWKEPLMFHQVEGREVSLCAQLLKIGRPDFKYYPHTGKPRYRYARITLTHQERLSLIISEKNTEP